MAVNLKKCQFCSKLYEYRGFDYCVDCAYKLDETFDLVRDYVYDCPNAAVPEILESTGVDEKYINYLIKTERLKMVMRTATVPCENCGRPTASGRYCAKCQAIFGKISDNLGEKSKQEPSADRSGNAKKQKYVMHTADTPKQPHDA